jgi:KaiC/GvpD/RAD55 family RecA-like ATPase
MTTSETISTGFQPLDWSLLDKVQATEPIIPDLLNEGESGALIGPAGVGKTLLGLDISVALARGEPVLGQPARGPITVMYIDMENSQAELAQRLRSMGYHPSEMVGYPLLYFSFPDLPPLDTVSGGRMLALEAERYDPQLIVFDSISRFVGGKEDAADTWQDFYAHTMLPLRRQNRTVLRLDHQGHDTSKGARGSSAKRDDVDVAWIMRRKGDDIELRLDKGRGLGHPGKVELRREAKPLRHVLIRAKSRLDQCVNAMDVLNIRVGVSRDEAADVLRENGYRFSNTVIGSAIRACRPSPTSGTEYCEDD